MAKNRTSPYRSATRISKTPVIRSALSRFHKTPEDEYETIEDLSSQSPEYDDMTQQFDVPAFDTPLGNFQDMTPLQPREPDNPFDKAIETPVEDIMEIIGPKARQKNNVPAKKRTRGKILIAATPEQLTNKLNQYLENIETNPKLQNIVAEDIQYSSNNQGYSVLIMLGQTPDTK